MKKINRREFLKYLSSALTLETIFMNSEGWSKEEKKEFYGLLVDITKCIGCRRCERACAEANGLPIPDISEEKNKEVFKTLRDTSTIQYTVINKYETEKGVVYVSRRCMHCNQPGCVAACLVKAMRKRETGQVTWDLNCIGCRLCMISCPFGIPKFEYEKAIPKIQKCDLCFDRFNKGLIPACVEACPTGALTFGKRRELIEEAKRRIKGDPDRYIPYIYGEYEVGGTCVLYLSSVPFEQIGFNTQLGYEPYPKYTTGFLYAVPFIFILWPLAMLGFRKAVEGGKKHREEEKKE
jgi:Fe-S-cluster-containing dehydrogenase component